VTLRNVPGAISATSDRQDDLTFAADVRGGTPMITTDAPAWLRRSDQAVTWGPHHAHRPPGVMKKVTGGLDRVPAKSGFDFLTCGDAARHAGDGRLLGGHGPGDDHEGS